MVTKKQAPPAIYIIILHKILLGNCLIRTFIRFSKFGKSGLAGKLKSSLIIDQQQLNRDNIAIFGISYGGYATMLSLTKKPSLWKAGCAWVGISHWLNMYEKSMPHFKNYMIQLFGDPSKEEVRNLMNERSPLNYIKNIKAPILLMHGVNDPRCPVDESRNFREKLIENGKIEGKDFEYVEFGEEGHTAMGDLDKDRTSKQ
ncbi:hypothetical protein LCGC14_2278750 [marine sediment metagenome]|uniref:Peptidase S9 prolyl oligopeptidase catalytic domain-containing protein n=1 Tax=marine sediment metagenome TaxID=412755 RepID=A0A0F9F769_9ZZZZ